MDLQAFINASNEMQARDRGNYHLTYGELIDALEAANPDKKVDKRFKGIGSWRGSYVEIAIFTEDSGYHAEKEEYFGEYGEDYKKWRDENELGAETLPKKAGDMAKLLNSLIGKDFVGWKGGNYKIDRYKPLWLTPEASRSDNVAIIDIDKDLNFITKEIPY